MHKVQEMNGLSPDITSMLVQQLTNYLHKDILELTENNSKNEQNVSLNEERRRESSTNSDNIPEPLYIITPTYRRPEQIPELTRMSHTLMLVKNVHWLVIEDARVATKQVTRLLKRTGLKFEHLTGKFNRLEIKT